MRNNFGKILVLVLILFAAMPCRAGVICDFNALGAQSPLLSQGFIDASSNILGNPVESQKARQILANVQKIYLHQASQSMAMFGWSDLPAELNGEAQKKALLTARMDKLKREAESQGYGFNYQLVSENPLAVEFNTAYPAKSWPQREIGTEIIVGDNCYATIRFGGNKLADPAADAAVIRIMQNEFLRYRDWVAANYSDSPKTDLEIRPLPGFNAKNFWDIMTPTLIIAFVIGMVISRTAQSRDCPHIQYFFRAMVGLWFIYVLILSLAKNYFIGPAYPLSLDHFVYAAIMIIINACGIIMGPIVIVPAIAMALAHSLRAAIFMAMNVDAAPRIIWFDVGLMTMLSIYVLLAGFRRRSSLPRPSGSIPKIVDRN